ncbi:MAG: Tn3 family transposase [Albidovulum sp.]|nr:Tn3 family transposase [Albidovulum sp.]
MKFATGQARAGTSGPPGCDLLERALPTRKSAGIRPPENLFRHISPLGWAHVLITGEYK